MEDKLNYFFEMDEAKIKEVEDWLKTVKPAVHQVRFVSNVEKAVKRINYSYKIATIEPSFSDNGEIFYGKGKKVATGHSLQEWIKKASEYFNTSSWYSKISNLDELFLWYGYRVARRMWTLSFICDNSSSEGNYKNSPGSSHKIDLSGIKMVGGFSDGVGNTMKLVQAERSYALCGGDVEAFGQVYPVAYYFPLAPAFDILKINSTAVLVVRERPNKNEG